MYEHDDRGSEGSVRRIDTLHAHISFAQRELFRLIADGDTRGAWHDEGARDMAHWLAMRQGISE